MVDRDFVASMKQDAILINTARGQLVDDLDAIFEAVHFGSIYAAGLDVLPVEPPGNSRHIEAWRHQPDYLEGRITISPHTAYYSREAWVEMRSKAAETIRLWATTGVQRNIIVGQPSEHSSG